MIKNKKGFALVETLVVSLVVATILIYIFVQFTNLKNNYDESFRYNDIDNLYQLEQIKNYINSMPANMKEEISSAITTDTYYIIDSTSALEFEKDLINEIGAKTLIITYADINDINTTSFSNNIKKMLKRVNNKSSNYRLIVEYDNNKVATMTFKMEGV